MGRKNYTPTGPSGRSWRIGPRPSPRRPQSLARPMDRTAPTIGSGGFGVMQAWVSCVMRHLC
eukprot:1994294-Alexandrium_andersonii.AAC.1